MYRLCIRHVLVAYISYIGYVSVMYWSRISHVLAMYGSCICRVLVVYIITIIIIVISINLLGRSFVRDALRPLTDVLCLTQCSTGR